MTIGTKSVLYGAHCFFLHPWFVAWAWLKLYGFRPVYIGSAPGYPQSWRWRLRFRGGPVFARLWDPRLWLVFVVHDLGYVGKPNMDGPEGELHPHLGARILSRLLDPGSPYRVGYGVWGSFSLRHSRFLAKQMGRTFSPLCPADKLAFALTPQWLYLPMVRATGEIAEYMRLADSRNLVGDPSAKPGKYATMNITTASQEAWFADVADYVSRWAWEHKDGRADTWTPDSEGANAG